MSSLTQFFSRFKGSVFGAILLISGCSIGVGMLFMPIVAGLSGFIPSNVIFVSCWLFMMSTAFLILEVLLAYPEKKHLITLAEKTIGSWGKIVIYITFLFQFYCIIIAYLDKGGEMVNEFLIGLGIKPLFWIGALLLGLVSTFLIYLGAKFVDQFNRICMISLFVTYFYLLTTGSGIKHPEYLDYQRWDLAFVAIPFFVIAFGFHNMLPTIKNYLGPNKKRLSIALLIGALIPFVIYFLWIRHTLKIVPPTGEVSILTSYKLEQLSTKPIVVLTNNKNVTFWAYYFTFFAIATSLFAVALSLLDFIADGINRTKWHSHRFLISVAIFLPTFIFSQTISHIFVRALEFAGGITTIILFGIMPVIMVWKKRYYLNNQKSQFIPGGKVMLSIIFLVASGVLIYEVLKNLGLISPLI